MKEILMDIIQEWMILEGLWDLDDPDGSINGPKMDRLMETLKEEFILTPSRPVEEMEEVPSGRRGLVSP